MTRKKRTPEENARREKIRELLQLANIGSMEDIQSLFKETIAEFMENGLESELPDWNWERNWWWNWQVKPQSINNANQMILYF